MSRIHIRSICGRSSRKVRRLLSEESGLALPLVLGVLALSALITAPFLTHASTNLIGSAGYERTINENYSADAGVEQAIWDLTDGNLASQIPAVGDSVSYTLPYQVNSVSPNVAVTRMAGGSSGAASGTITRSIISSLQFDTNGFNPVMLSVSSGVYAVVYRDSSNRVVLKTLAISSGGTITQTLIDSQIIDNTGYEPDLVNIAAGIYAVVYRGSSNKGYIATFQIAANGNINNTLLSKLVYNSSNNYEPRIIHTSGSFYLVVYRGSSHKGYASTLQISADGSVSAAPVSTFVFDSTCYEPYATPVGSGYYALAYRGASNKGNLVTIAVDGNGIISGNLISSLLFTNTNGYTPVILNISGSTYGIAYRGSSNYGYLTTLNVSTAGIISSPVISTFKFEGSACYEPDIISISGSIYAVAYRGPSNDGYLKTIDIAPDGTANQIVDTFVFDASTGYEPWIVNISDSIYAVAYRSGKGTGYIRTIEIAADTAVTYQIVSVAGGTTTTASVTTDNGISKITSWLIDR